MRPHHLLLTILTASVAFVVKEGRRCTLYPESLHHFGQEVNDVPSIHKAFKLCGHDGEVVFTDNVFHIQSVMNTTGLENCDVSLQGELRFSTDIPYWLSHSYSVVLQNQSTAWLFGGENVTFRGQGGWYNGNGQHWYTQNQNQANQPGRPISITIFESKNVLIDNLIIEGPQFWATFVWKSQNVSITNFYSNATTNNEWSTINTDGFDSWNSDTILIENATVASYDDCLAPKGNTTNLTVRNLTCHWTNGVTIGSVGQYPEWPDYVENVLFENVRLIGSKNGAYIKTWQGIPGDDAPTGGGRGLIRNITFRNFEMDNNELPILINQCTYTEDAEHNCDTSKMAIEDVTWENFRGTSKYNIVASLYCTPVHPCPGITFKDVDIISVNKSLGLPLWDTTLQDEVYQCANLVDESGVPCNKVAPSNFGQHPKANVKE